MRIISIFARAKNILVLVFALILTLALALTLENNINDNIIYFELIPIICLLYFSFINDMIDVFPGGVSGALFL